MLAIGTSCLADDVVTLEPPLVTIEGTHEACRELTAQGVEVVAPGVEAVSAAAEPEYEQAPEPQASEVKVPEPETTEAQSPKSEPRDSAPQPRDEAEAQVAAVERRASESEAFIAPPPAQPEPRRQATVESGGSAEPFAAAAVANGSRDRREQAGQQEARPQAPRRQRGLFARMTEAARRMQGEDSPEPRPAVAPQARARPERAPAPQASRPAEQPAPHAGPTTKTGHSRSPVDPEPRLARMRRVAARGLHISRLRDAPVNFNRLDEPAGETLAWPSASGRGGVENGIAAHAPACKVGSDREARGGHAEVITNREREQEMKLTNILCGLLIHFLANIHLSIEEY